MTSRTDLIMQKALALSCNDSSDAVSDRDPVRLSENINNLPIITDEDLHLSTGYSSTSTDTECLSNNTKRSFVNTEAELYELLPVNNFELLEEPFETITLAQASTEDFSTIRNEISGTGSIMDEHVEEAQNTINILVDYDISSSDVPSSSNMEDEIPLSVIAGTVSATTSTKEIVANFPVGQEQREGDKEEIQYTKSGEVRKRRKIQEKPAERKKKKFENNKTKHPVLPPCKNECKLKCASHFFEERRRCINEQFWTLSYFQRRAYVLNSCERLDIKRRCKGTDGGGYKNFTFKYALKTGADEIKHVCKTFFLTTLGYKPSNDRFVHEVLSKTPKGSIAPLEDKRGKQRPTNFISKTEIDEHIETFNPAISHYRRDHAPNVRYLPSDVTVNFMHQDFLNKNPTIKVSYNVYRLRVKAKNISFAKLGNEECEVCESFDLHGHNKTNMVDDCKVCVSWKNHIELAEEGRKMYRKMAKENEEGTYFSADLEKIIMLPRVDTFKKVIFIKRLTVYNESFVALGKKNKVSPFAVLWHDGISGRNQEDVVSTFYAFFKRHRDSKSLTLWLDNCSSQNKSWCLMSFLVYIVNSDEISAENIDIRYFEPGHTFMSADSFHHQVELSLKKQGKTYDFPDFVQAVKSANNGKVDIKEMKHSDFFKWANHSSQKKLKQPDRTYLRNIVQIIATRGNFYLLHKTSYSETEPLNCLDFLTVKAMKNGLKRPDHLDHPCGFPADKRDNILKTLDTILPQNRKEFWLNIPVPVTNN